MISVTEAQRIIKENTVALQPVKLFLQQAAGKILAEDVYATIDIPAYPQSAMDGYAFAFNDWLSQKKIHIEGEVAAGSNAFLEIASGKAVRIFTGAPVPSGVDTVVMQEKVKVQDGALFIEDEKLKSGANVRPMGSEIKAGELALEKGSMLSAAAIGFLAGIGITELLVNPNPVISIIVTGNELQQPGQALEYGQVYESNSFSLTAALENLHINTLKIYKADDQPEIVTAILGEALQHSDMVLLTGGVSVGDYDFVLQAANNCSVTQLFHKVKQRPGKPLYFGKKGNKLVFGLPGNPSSVLTCFYEYAVPALGMLSKRNISLPILHVPLKKSFKKVTMLTHFLKGYYDGKTATYSDSQESYRLGSFAKANCMIKIDEEVTECKEGEVVEIHLLPV